MTQQVSDVVVHIRRPLAAAAPIAPAVPVMCQPASKWSGITALPTRNAVSMPITRA